MLIGLIQVSGGLVWDCGVLLVWGFGLGLGCLAGRGLGLVCVWAPEFGKVSSMLVPNIP